MTLKLVKLFSKFYDLRAFITRLRAFITRLTNLR